MMKIALIKLIEIYYDINKGHEEEEYLEHLYAGLLNTLREISKTDKTRFKQEHIEKLKMASDYLKEIKK